MGGGVGHRLPVPHPKDPDPEEAHREPRPNELLASKGCDDGCFTQWCTRAAYEGGAWIPPPTVGTG